MTDDERRLLGCLNDALFLLARSLEVSRPSQDVVTEALRGTPAKIGPDTKLGDLIGDMRFPSGE